MKKIDIVLRELKKKIVTNGDIDKIAKKYKLDPLNLRKLLLNKGYLVTIFRGIYYLKSYEEKKLNTIKFSSYELLSIGLKMKNIKWYFGLSSALKFLNLTHEIFPLNYVVNSKFNRVKPLRIAGSKFLFIKLKPSLFFGMKKRKTKNNVVIFYSNLEKTILDFVYLKKKIDFEEHVFNKRKLLNYLKNYDNKTKKLITSKVKNG